MAPNFYDKIAKKLGGYGYGIKPQYIKEYSNGNPEKIFKEKILNLSSKNKIALDIGCADGKFTVTLAPYFKKIYGIDISRVNLKIAKTHLGEEKNNNIEFSYQDASHTLFESLFFDLAYCRRGPSFYKEYYRVLKTKGYYLEIGIGETDSIELKKIFGRGQGYGKLLKSKLDADLNELRNLGFQIIFAQNYHYFEYYPTYEQLDLFLQGVPIFEDFDSEKDGKLLRRYAEKFTTKKGVQLSRHRLVLVAQKVK